MVFNAEKYVLLSYHNVMQLTYQLFPRSSDMLPDFYSFDHSHKECITDSENEPDKQYNCCYQDNTNHTVEEDKVPLCEYVAPTCMGMGM